VYRAVEQYWLVVVRKVHCACSARGYTNSQRRQQHLLLPHDDYDDDEEVGVVVVVTILPPSFEISSCKVFVTESSILTTSASSLPRDTTCALICGVLF
jgi:hypothetical protein